MPTIVMTGEDTFRFFDDKPADQRNPADPVTYYADEKSAPTDVQEAMKRKGMDSLLVVRGQAQPAQQPTQQAQRQQAQQPVQQQRQAQAAQPVTNPALAKGPSGWPSLAQMGASPAAAPQVRQGAIGASGGNRQPTGGIGALAGATFKPQRQGLPAPQTVYNRDYVAPATPLGVYNATTGTIQTQPQGTKGKQAQARTVPGQGFQIPQAQNFVQSPAPYYNTLAQDLTQNPVAQAIGQVGQNIAAGYQALPEQANRKYVADATRNAQAGLAAMPGYAGQAVGNYLFESSPLGMADKSGLSAAVGQAAGNIVTQVLPKYLDYSPSTLAVNGLNMAAQAATPLVHSILGEPRPAVPVGGAPDDPAMYYAQSPVNPTRDAVMDAILQNGGTLPQTSRQIWRGSGQPDDAAMYQQGGAVSFPPNYRVPQEQDYSTGSMADSRVTGGQRFTPAPYSPPQPMQYAGVGAPSDPAYYQGSAARQYVPSPAPVSVELPVQQAMSPYAVRSYGLAGLPPMPAYQVPQLQDFPYRPPTYQRRTYIPTGY